MPSRANPAGIRAARGVPMLLLLLCCVPLAVVTVRLFLPPWPLYDFLGYWACGRLFLEHANPYSGAALLALERSMGWQQNWPLMMWSPPWALPLVAVFGALPFHVARLLWLGVSAGLDLFSAIGIWDFFGGERRSAWIAIAVFLTFVPLGAAEGMGQPTPLLLASITAFLLLVRGERWLLAGVCLFGCGMKPHLPWLVLAAVIFWALRNRRFTLLLGAALPLAASWLAAVAFNPLALHYLHDSWGSANAIRCGVGAELCILVGRQDAWLRYLPSGLGAAWFCWYWARHRRDWDWRRDLPLLMLVSVASAPYSWFHDFLIALPAFVALAVRGAWRSPLVVAGWFGLQVLILSTDSKPLASTYSALWIVFWLFAEAEGRRNRMTSTSLQEREAIQADLL